MPRKTTPRTRRPKQPEGFVPVTGPAPSAPAILIQLPSGIRIEAADVGDALTAALALSALEPEGC